MKNIITQALQILFILAAMTIGFVFVGAFVECKTSDDANIYAVLTFAIILCSVLSVATFMTIKEFLNEGV